MLDSAAPPGRSYGSSPQRYPTRLKIPFTKMHGAGNDFVVLDATTRPLQLTPALYRAIADRHFGVGADQILVVGPAPNRIEGAPEVDFSYRIFNADGGEVEQCGNGARAFVRYVLDHGLSRKNPLRVSTLSGVIEPFLESDGSVTVQMGRPNFDVEKVPFDPAGLVARRQGKSEFWTLDLGSGAAEIAVASMGNPHAVQIVASVDKAPVLQQGPLLECHARFPKRVNVGFMEIQSPRQIKLRVWERGAGETLACGTGACAAVVLGIQLGLLEPSVLVHTHGGDLRIGWAGPGHSVQMNGPSVSVFEGVLDLAALPGWID